jgi:glucose/arabinose dehydrogenase
VRAVLAAAAVVAATAVVAAIVVARDDGGIAAAFPAALTVADDGDLVWGERLTGRIVRRDADGSLEEIGRVEVSTDGEQRGLLGVALDGDALYAAYTAPDGRLEVARVDEDRLVWAGPPSADRANGGRLAFSPDGELVIGVGDLLDPDAAADPDAPNGKLLALDPTGAADQVPTALSGGWNNPFAFAYAPDGTLFVADNAGGEGDERLAIATAGEPQVLATLGPHAAPSGLAVLPDGRLALCTYVTRTLQLYRVAEGVATPDGSPAATDCAIAVVTLPDGSLAYADEERIRLLAS